MLEDMQRKWTNKYDVYAPTACKLRDVWDIRPVRDIMIGGMSDMSCING